MATTYAAIDLETTGVDPAKDDITEIGVVRFDVSGRRETMRTFVRSAVPIPYRIRLLTNIEQADVDGAPHFDEIRDELIRFVGEAPIIGQNVSFDLDFLARKGVAFPGPVYDTAELARVLLWETREHGLAALAARFGIPFPVRHRALADAEVTADVFLALRDRALQLPRDVLAEIARIASMSPWSMSSLLADLALAASVAPAEGAPATGGASRREAWPPLAALEEPLVVTEDEAIGVLANRGASALQGFERRPQQERMAGAVANALSEGAHLLVEAGTGTGKSMAYLVPAALYALRNDARVVVSTNTIALQEQLWSKDVPALRSMLGEGTGEALRVGRLKGRRNYLCLRRWTALRHAGPYSADEAKLLARIAVWLPHTKTGDRAELDLTSGEEAVWSRVAANESCGSACVQAAKEVCFLHRARRQAEGAHVLIVNHALLLSDIATGGFVLPEYDHLIIDEAHHIEAEATKQFGFVASQAQVGDWLDRLHTSRTNAPVTGLAAALRGAARFAAAEPLGAGATSALRDATEEIARAVGEAKSRVAAFFAVLRDFIGTHAAESGEYERQLLITAAVRRQPAWFDVEVAWDELTPLLRDALTAVERARTALLDGADLMEVDAVGLAEECEALAAEGQRLLDGIATIVGREDVGRIAWLSAPQSGPTSVQAAPLHVGDLLREALFERRRSIVLTGATLATGEGFGYQRERLGIEEARELRLGSPFDYRAAALVLLPRNIPEPGQPGYQNGIQSAVLELVRASEGHALVLMTSHSAVRATAEAIRAPLEAEGILVQAHGVDGPPGRLIATLREHPRCVVLGTATFWEGVDIVGAALSLVIIAKLPFSVPTEPVFAARSQLFDDPFSEYALPAAVLKFRQGFGRLIRHRDDRGCVAILDRRVRSKMYGQAFLEALPDCVIEDVAAATMPLRVRGWLKGGDG